MAEEIDDSEFFQQDFTTASEWEIFNARLEEHFHEWKLSFVEPGPPLKPDQLSLCEWLVSKETVQFADVTLSLTRYCCRIPSANPETEEPGQKSCGSTEQPLAQAFSDLMSLQNNYSLLDEKVEGVHPVARWYGLRDFVVLAPVKKALSNASQIRILLSSIHIAVAESNCEVPVFLQALEGRQHVYNGVCESRSTRLNFDIVHLRNAPASCKYLTGLVDMFKGKIGVQYSDPVQVSVRFAFSLDRFAGTNAAMAAELDFEDIDSAPVEKLFKLTPFRVSIDPLTELILYCGWPLIAENVVIDSQNYSDFNPLNAPAWSIRARFDARSICHMSECIGEYLQLHGDQRTLADLLGNGFNMLGDESDRNPFGVLTESKISAVLPSFVGSKSASSSAGSKKAPVGPSKLDGPLTEEQLMQMLYYMFPDAQAMSSHQYELPENDPVRNSNLFYVKILLFYKCSSVCSGGSASHQIRPPRLAGPSNGSVASVVQFLLRWEESRRTALG